MTDERRYLYSSFIIIYIKIYLYINLYCNEKHKLYFQSPSQGKMCRRSASMRNSSLRNSSAKSSTNQIPTENNSSQVGYLDMRENEGETHFEPFSFQPPPKKSTWEVIEHYNPGNALTGAPSGQTKVEKIR